MNRKRVILAVLIGLLAISLLYAYIATPRLEKAPPRIASQRVRADVREPGLLHTKGDQQRINFAFLTVEQQKFPGAKRDIFRFGGRRLVERAPQAAPRVPVKKAVAMPVSPPPVPVDVVKKALSQFTFLGFLEKGGEKTVFLSSGGDLFMVKSGESFGAEQEFLITEIDNRLLKVRHAGREGLIEIPLIDQQKLNASVSRPADVQPGAKVPNQPRAGKLTPKRKLLRPAASQEREEPFTEEPTEPSGKIPIGKPFTNPFEKLMLKTTPNEIKQEQ